MSQPARKDSDTSRAKWARLRILVAEDNEINQMVIIGLLRKLGASPHLVSNGLEAVAAQEREAFDLILMDCQMPELDGYDAAAKIRLLAAPLSSVPIIALTANATQGDRQRCLQAGMNDHVAKPIDLNKLTAAILPYLDPAMDLSAPLHEAPGSTEHLDSQAIASLAFLATGPNVNFVAELIETFLESTPARLTKMKTAALTRDLKSVHFEAHALKSAAGTLGTALFAKLCQELEDQGETGSEEQIGRLLSLLEAEFNCIKDLLPALAVTMGLGRT